MEATESTRQRRNTSTNTTSSNASSSSSSSKTNNNRRRGASPSKYAVKKVKYHKRYPFFLRIVALLLLGILVLIVVAMMNRSSKGGVFSGASSGMSNRLRGDSTKTSTSSRVQQIRMSDAHPLEGLPASSSSISSTNNNEEVIDLRTLFKELPFDNPNNEGISWKQGWDITPNNTTGQPLEIYVVPHSHCDPGWVHTFDEYYEMNIRGVLTSVYEALKKDKRRRFIWAEISTFERWWSEQSAQIKQSMQELIQNKQFEFVTGGWVQPDEAITNLYALEIQLQEGHDWLHNTFGQHSIPQYGWSIDAKGHSPTVAHMLKKHGFKGMVIQRVHYAIKKELAGKQHLEFRWRQQEDDDFGDEDQRSDILTHVMPFYNYDVSYTCGPDPKICCGFDFARLVTHKECEWDGVNPVGITQENVERRSRVLLDQYRKKASLYRSNVLLVPLGDDYSYQTTDETEAQYTNYQKIFDYMNNEMDDVLSIQFGTLSEYFEAVQQQQQQKTTKSKSFQNNNSPVLKGSFLTYADRDEDYYSGYYTSRVFDKALDRRLESLLYAATTMGATKEQLQHPRRTLSLFQHHHAITGTARHHVVKDYARMLFDSINFVQDWMAAKINTDNHHHHNKDQDGSDMVQSCWVQEDPRSMRRNVCDVRKPVYLYNPLSTPQTWCSMDVDGISTAIGEVSCDAAALSFKSSQQSSSIIEFDDTSGLMVYPFQESWMVWHVKQGGASLFSPQQLTEFADTVSIEDGGYKVSGGDWKRTVIEQENGVIDMIYETNLQQNNQEWSIRFQTDIQNDGIFHTDLNGAGFDAHTHRDDLPIQANVHPMPGLVSIQDENTRFTILSEHAHGVASMEGGGIDVWLDRRLVQDDHRGLGQGLLDNVPTMTRLRVVMEDDFERESVDGGFKVTPWCQLQWDKLNHPLEMFGIRHTKAHKDKISQ